MTTQLASSAFWPSRRLWVKFFIGLFYAPLLFLLLFWLFIRAVFLRGLYLASFFLLFVGGPISIGLLLSPGRRGATAGLVTVFAIPIIWSLAGIIYRTFGFRENQLFIGLIAATVVILLEIMTGDVGGRVEIVGLGIGLAVALFLLFVNTSLVGSFIYTGNDELLLFSLYPPNALVWLSALFFPEWVSGKVGRGGIIIWIVLILVVFGLSFTLVK
jgi:hypothetical protein